MPTISLKKNMNLGEGTVRRLALTSLAGNRIGFGLVATVRAPTPGNQSLPVFGSLNGNDDSVMKARTEARRRIDAALHRPYDMAGKGCSIYGQELAIVRQVVTAVINAPS